MKELVASFTAQLRQALDIGDKVIFSKPKAPIHNVLITGLGGSGIGGTIISQMIDKEVAVPVTVNKDYFIPGYVNENTLVIVSSYSGNTEETLAALELAAQRKATIVCINIEWFIFIHKGLY
jgi:glucose/mannose-6-phosphate isomerase